MSDLIMWALSGGFWRFAGFMDKEPVWVLQRQPLPEKKQTRYEIWIEDDGMALTPHQLADLLADTLKKSVKSKSGGK